MAYSIENNTTATELPIVANDATEPKYEQEQQAAYEGDQISSMKSRRHLVHCSLAGWIILLLLFSFAIGSNWQKITNKKGNESSKMAKSYLDKVEILQAQWVTQEEQINSTLLPKPTTTDTNNMSWVHIMNLDRNAITEAYENHRRVVVEVPAWWNPTSAIINGDGSSTQEDISPRIVGDGATADTGLRDGYDTPIVISYDISTNGIMRFPADDVAFDSTKDFGLVGKMAPSDAGNRLFGIECMNGRSICTVYLLASTLEEINDV